MSNLGEHNILGIRISAVDYEHAVERIVRAATEGRAFAVSALAVHGVMTGYLDLVHRRRLNGLDLIVPDGQPIRWALRWLHGVALPDRVYGPTLTLKVLETAALHTIPVFFYGSRQQTLDRLTANLQARFPGLVIAGSEPSQFRKLNSDEKRVVVDRIRSSGAKIVFVGLGCPRQEVWAYEYREHLQIPILAVGAAFDFHAGTLPQAPQWMQERGLEWAYRLFQEPIRLWRRYLLLNPAYLLGVGLQLIGAKRNPIRMPDGEEPEESFG